MFAIRSLTSEFDVVLGRALVGQKQEQAKSRTNAYMGRQSRDINPLRERVRARAGGELFAESFLAQIHASQNLHARGRRGRLRRKYRHRVLDRLADTDSVQAPRKFLAIDAYFQSEFRFLIHPATCMRSAG
jgi:hypothetical protein